MILHEIVHFSLSLIVALVAYKYTRRLWALLPPLLTGFFLDVDHLIDYFIYRRALRFDIHEFATGNYFDVSQKIYLVLHSYELAMLLLIFGAVFKKPNKFLSASFFAAALSLVLHLIYDTIYYKPDWNTYLLISRIASHWNLAAFHFH